MATSRRKPAIPPLRSTDLRELQQVISNIRERLDQLDDAVASAAAGTATSSTRVSGSASSARTADTLTTPRNFDLAGVVTAGPQPFDGSDDVTIEVLEVPLALLEQDGATVAQVLAWDGSGGWTPTTLLDTEGPIDHGALMGLADDDHPHYLNQARGDARYSQLGHTHSTEAVTGLVELIQDTFAGSAVAGSGVTITYDDGAGTLTFEATGGGSGGFANPMLDYGDLIVGQSAGSPARLAPGADGQVLTMSAGLPSWQDPTGGGGGMPNPMLDFGDLIYGQSAGSPARLPIGAEGQVLRVVSGLPSWDDEAAGGGDRWTYLKLTADHINGTVTPSDIPDLQFNFPSAGSYEIEGKLLVQTEFAAVHPRLTAYEPNNANGAWVIFITQNTSSGFTATGGTGATGGITSGGTARNVNLPMLAYVDAFYIASAASTTPWKMGLVSETSNTNVRVLAGSFVRWRKLP